MVIWKGIFQSIGNQFIGDEAYGDGCFCIQFYWFDFIVDLYLMVVQFKGICYCFIQFVEVGLYIQGGGCSFGVELLMDQFYGVYLVLAFVYGIKGVFVLYVVGLQVKQVGEDLQVVFDLVVDFVEKGFNGVVFLLDGLVVLQQYKCQYQEQFGYVD